MNEHYVDALQILLNNELAMKAVREVFNQAISEQLPNIENESDEIVGAKYRAYAVSVKTLESAFQKLEEYRKFKETRKGVVNPI